MGKVYDKIDESVKTWVDEQDLFFVATSPLANSGRVNCSPKGMDSLRIMGEHRIAYADHIGSGSETIAHLRENGRIVLMLCAFKGAPKIMRFHGTGRVVLEGEVCFEELKENFSDMLGLRAIIDIEVKRVSDSCGWGVPEYEMKNERDLLHNWADKKGKNGILNYQKENNKSSIDGLPSLK